MSEKKRDAGYRAALTGAKGTVRLLIYVCVILVIILAAKTSYQFGHDVFAEEPKLVHYFDIPIQRKRKGSHRTGAFRHGGKRTR